MDTSLPPAAFKLKDAAIFLGGVHVDTLRRAIKQGRLKRSHLFRHILITRTELERFLKEEG